ncbi:MAG: phosphoribosylglycinamide formyltransferase [Flavobacteriales bacterium]|nr:phosphoribosylglycinamide formyltransferase [Flavobacteriales bacterium]
MTNICIFASGNGSNAEAIINYFTLNSSINVQLIISSREDAYVLQRAKNHGISSLVLNKGKFRESEDLLDDLHQQDIDYIVLAGFMWLVPVYLIETYPNKIINIHPALLPKYGGKGMYGSFVHEAVIAAKEQQSGITVHYVNENYDEGAIIAQETCTVADEDTVDTLAEKIHRLEHQHFPRIIEEVITGFQAHSSFSTSG